MELSASSDSPLQVKTFREHYSDILHEAINNGDYDAVVDLLYKEKIHQDSLSTTRRMSALYNAVWKNNVAIAEELLKCNAWVDYGGRIGKFPLFAAVNQENLEMTKLLLKYGASTELKYVNGNTPLLEAVARGNYELVMLLLNSGSDMYQCNNGGDSVLHMSTLRNLRILKVFLDRGFEPNVEKSDGKAFFKKSGIRPLHITTVPPNGGYFESAKLLIQYGADVNIKTSSGRTPLHLAAMRNATKVAKVLISHGCDIECISMENEEHKTALAKAVDENNNEMVELLIDAGADLNIPDHYGASPLFASAFGNKILITKVLIQAGCDVNQVTNNHMSPLEAAVQHLNSESHDCALKICKMLLLAGSSIINLLQSLQLHDIMDSELISWIIHPKKLKQLARERIRLFFFYDLNNKIIELPLPKTIIDFLLMKDTNSFID